MSGRLASYYNTTQLLPGMPRQDTTVVVSYWVIIMVVVVNYWVRVVVVVRYWVTVGTLRDYEKCLYRGGHAVHS